MLHLNNIQQKQAQHRAKLLLQNILPKEIIPRFAAPPPPLNIYGHCRLQSAASGVVVDVFDEATVMFVNIINLEELTEGLYLSPECAKFHNL